MAPRMPKRNARFMDTEGEMARGMSALEALRGYFGAPSQASVMTPGALSAYEGGSWAGVGDLHNTGLRKVGDKYVTLEELKSVPRDGLGLPIGYEPLDDRPAWKDGGVVEFPKITPKAMLSRVISAYNAL